MTIHGAPSIRECHVLYARGNRSTLDTSIKCMHDRIFVIFDIDEISREHVDIVFVPNIILNLTRESFN